MTTEVKKINEREVSIVADVTPRDFSTGSVGYGAYGAVTVDGFRHQMTLNVTVQGSKKWTDEKKLAWLGEHNAVVEVKVGGMIDLFQSGNTGWRINAPLMVGGESCTASGGVILSKKTLETVAKKAAKLAETEAKRAKALSQHNADIKALKASLKPMPKSHTLMGEAE